MFSSSGLYLHQFLTFTLVFVRIGALVAIAPVFGSSDVPVRMRALMALALAALIAPLQFGRVTGYPDTLVGYLVLVGAEALIGLTLGLGIMVLFSGMQVAGQVISQMSGMQLADVFNPSFNENVPVFSQLLFHVSVAVFVIIGGHRKVMEALLDTFVWLPAGQGGFSRSVVEAMTSLLAQSFLLGVRAAAPAMVALLLATLVLGLLSRTLPQLNVMALGFGFNALVTLGALSISLGAAAWIFQDEIAPVLATLVAALKSG
ncbi:MAG TPA: flagellar biosynthetic protein FliR [Pirellulales bacterium]|jgi:flagellar biosynthetic protein FliR|nr:flagellar biosynthetic protein FliR [Pirellulales bacterium]